MQLDFLLPILTTTPINFQRVPLLLLLSSINYITFQYVYRNGHCYVATLLILVPTLFVILDVTILVS